MLIQLDEIKNIVEQSRDEFGAFDNVQSDIFKTEPSKMAEFNSKPSMVSQRAENKYERKKES